MAVCEECWRDAGSEVGLGKERTVAYRRLVAERDSDSAHLARSLGIEIEEETL